MPLIIAVISGVVDASPQAEMLSVSSRAHRLQLPDSDLRSARSTEGDTLVALLELAILKESEGTTAHGIYNPPTAFPENAL